jgi:Resolvase, N terminal domain
MITAKSISSKVSRQRICVSNGIVRCGQVRWRPPARQRTLRAKGASLKATEQPIDTSTAAGKCFLDILGVFAEFETNLRRERQLEGIAKAKAAGGPEDPP